MAGAAVEDPPARARLAGQLIGQNGPEEMLAHEGLVDTAEAIQGQVAKASPHRVAHQQRAGQNGRADGHTAGHGEIRPPVKP